MSYAEDIRQQLYNNDTSKTIKAVIYARVSTDNTGQKDSCMNQVELAKSYIAKHKNITLLGTFVDDGISGKSDYNRPEYNKMLDLITTNNIDLLITKSLSRLHRDTQNSFFLSNILVQNNTTLLTLEDNQIHDFEDINSDILHSINFAIDAQYVKRQSISGKKVQEVRCTKKELSAKDCQSYGYNWESTTKIISINKAAADIVRWIFDEYVFRNGTPASIQKMLKTKNINKSEHTITNMLQDERYIGKFYINKQTSKLGVGNNKTKRIKLPKDQWVLVERPDLQIVDREIFETAQRVRKNRITIYEKPAKKTTQARFQGFHKYSGKIFCPTCNKPFNFGYSDRKQTNAIYRIRSHSECTNPVHRVNERDIDEITKIALKNLFDQQDDVFKNVLTILNQCIVESQNNDVNISTIKKLIETKKNQLDKLTETLIDDDLLTAVKDSIKVKANTIAKEIEALQSKILHNETNKLDKTYVSKKMDEIKSAIFEMKNFKKLDRARILNYIERIELLSNNDVNILLKSGHFITIKAANVSKGDDVVKKVNPDAPY